MNKVEATRIIVCEAIKSKVVCTSDEIADLVEKTYRARDDAEKPRPPYQATPEVSSFDLAQTQTAS